MDNKNLNSNLKLRVEADHWVKMLPPLVIVTRTIGLISIVIAALTLPWVKAFLNLAFNLNLRLRLDLTVLGYDFYLMALTFIVSMAGLLIQSKRTRRRKDRSDNSFLIFGGVSFLMMAVYLGYLWWGR